MKVLYRKIMAVALTLIMTLALLPLTAQPAYAVGGTGNAGHLNTISLGSTHSAAVSANGDLYTWGDNDYGLSIYLFGVRTV